MTQLSRKDSLLYCGQSLHQTTLSDWRYSWKKTWNCCCPAWRFSGETGRCNFARATLCFLSLPPTPCTERAMPSLCPMGLAWCNGLPTTHYSYKVSANHTIDPVIPPIWNSLPRLAVSMSEDRVPASLPASFPVVLPATRCLWGGDWDLCNLSPSQLCFLFGIHLV